MLDYIKVEIRLILCVDQIFTQVLVEYSLYLWLEVELLIYM